MTGSLQRISQPLSAYLELGKPALSGLVALTAGVGFVIATVHPPVWKDLLWVTGGTLLAALGANALNQWLEVRRDLKMHRTMDRPLPSGRLTSNQALLWGLAVALIGDAVLWLCANPLSASLGLLAQLSYLFFYTPLKTRTSFCTLAGAVSGSIPPIIGWVAAAGSVHYGALILAATLFIWQVPHFLALAWMYRRDYARGGFIMLPVWDDSGRMTCQVIVIYSLALLPICLLSTLAGVTGQVYAGGSLLLGAGFLYLGALLYRRRRVSDARRLFLGSVVYLPLLMLLMLIDSGGAAARRNVRGAVMDGPVTTVTSAWVEVTTIQGGQPNQG